MTASCLRGMRESAQGCVDMPEDHEGESYGRKLDRRITATIRLLFPPCKMAEKENGRPGICIETPGKCKVAVGYRTAVT